MVPIHSHGVSAEGTPPVCCHVTALLSCLPGGGGLPMWLGLANGMKAEVINRTALVRRPFYPVCLSLLLPCWTREKRTWVRWPAQQLGPAARSQRQRWVECPYLCRALAVFRFCYSAFPRADYKCTEFFFSWFYLFINYFSVLLQLSQFSPLHSPLPSPPLLPQSVPTLLSMSVGHSNLFLD